ncbi:MAG: choice-of-anchor tandem repeat GloVer-containing protein, partial [Candidatus Sulfotelmatobacter sp.]
MLSKKYHLGIIVVLTTIATLMTSAAFAATEKVLHSFGNNADGTYPIGIVFDSHGNLYGTTAFGGVYNNGTVFELAARRGGGVTEKVLHSFGNGSDGAQPFGGLLLSSQGILVGTTSIGGAYAAGTVFALVPKTGGGWAEKILYSFGGRPDGSGPGSGLIADAAGNLYGITGGGGAFGLGTVFELVRKSGGGWAEKILYSFGTSVTDGFGPAGNLIFGPGGSLFGVTSEGGQMFCTVTCGTVFQ